MPEVLRVVEMSLKETMTAAKLIRSNERVGYCINEDGKLDFHLDIDPAKYEVSKAGTPQAAGIGVLAVPANSDEWRRLQVEEALAADRKAIERLVSKKQLEAGIAAINALYDNPIEEMTEKVPRTSSGIQP